MSFAKKPGDRSVRIDLGKLSLVRLSTHGKRYEIVVNPEQAWLYKQGNDVPIDEIVEGYTVFENFSRGLKANKDDLVELFKTSDDREIVKHVLDKGELLITQEQRKRFLKEKQDEIIQYLVTHAVNPKSGAPHPPSVIEKAMDDAGVRIDQKRSASEQAKDMIADLNKIIPIKIETSTIEFIIPAKLTGKLYGMIQGAGEVVKEEWGNDGTLTMILKVPAGLTAKILEKISDTSKGAVRSTVIERSG